MNTELVEPQRSVARRSPDTSFYRWASAYFAIAFLIVIGGFWPSFLMRLGDTAVGHMIHGISATLWMIVPIVQAVLIRRGRFAWHRRVGRSTLVLALILVVSGFHVVGVMILDVPGTPQPLRGELVFLDTSALVVFAVLFGLALASIYRGNVSAHAGYMTCTVLVALEPGLERLLVQQVPGIDNFQTGLRVTLIAMAILCAGLAAAAWRTRNSSRPYLLTLGFFLGSYLLLSPMAAWSAFQELARACAARF